MAKSKIIEDKDTIGYLDQMWAFAAKINPKPSEEEREKLKQEYLMRRVKVEVQEPEKH